MDNVDAIIPQTRCADGSLNFVLLANQMERADLLVSFERAFDAFDDNPAAVVATHDIHYDSHKWGKRRDIHICPLPQPSKMNQDPALMVMTWRPL